MQTWEQGGPLNAHRKPMRAIRQLLVVSAALAMLAACGDDEPAVTTSETSPADEPSESQPSEPVGEQASGQYELAAGDTVVLTPDAAVFGDVEVTVADIQVGAECPTGRLQPTGELVGIDLTVRPLGEERSVGFLAAEWTATTSSGQESPTDPLAASVACQAPTDQFPIEFGGAGELSGTLLFDVPKNTERITATVPFVEPSPELSFLLP